MEYDTVHKAGSTSIFSPPGSIGDPRHAHLGGYKFIFHEFLLGQFAYRVAVFNGMDVETARYDRTGR